MAPYDDVFPGDLPSRLPPPPMSPMLSHFISSTDDLRFEQFPEIRYVVPRYVAEGCTILAGRPKLGKSWLALDLCWAVATGNYCLGNALCEKGDVLYLALEDNRRRFQRRLRKLAPSYGDTWPTFDFVTLEKKFPRADQGGLQAIEAWAKAKPKPTLVVIDVWAKFQSLAVDGKKTLYRGDYEAIQPLQELAALYGFALIIVHHVRKSQGDGDPFEKVSGTLGLTGAADTTLVLDRSSNGVTLYGRGRDIEEVEDAIRFNTETCRWTVEGAVNEVRKSDERARIISMLKDAKELLSPKIISVVCKMPRNNVDALLYKMADAGEVVRAGRGLYAHPSRNDLIEGAKTTAA